MKSHPPIPNVNLKLTKWSKISAQLISFRQITLIHINIKINWATNRICRHQYSIKIKIRIKVIKILKVICWVSSNRIWTFDSKTSKEFQISNSSSSLRPKIHCLHRRWPTSLRVWVDLSHSFTTKIPRHPTVISIPSITIPLKTT